MPEPAADTVVSLAGETDFDGFRLAARRLLAEGVAPERVVWSVADPSAPDLFAAPGDAARSPGAATLASAPDGDPTHGDKAPIGGPGATDASSEGDGDGGELVAAAASPSAAHRAAPDGAAPLRVSAALMAELEHVALHREPQRFALIYRLLWRLQREPGLRDDPLDPDMAAVRLMAQAVRRDLHKMKAFVRFREVQRDASAPVLHVAWFEPVHHTVEAVSGFFVRRFAGMHWALLTPERSVHWDGHALRFAPGARREDAPPADAGEALWLTYYASIFNPARLKIRAMENEMPRRYWRNLPEATLIGPLAAQSAARSAQMLAQAPTTPRRRIAGVPAAALAAGGPARLACATGRPSGTAPPATQAAPGEPTAPAAMAREASADDRAAALAGLRTAAAVCRECPLGALATQTVWGEGPLAAALMLVGEQPGDQEDLQGRPFVGPSGQLLDRALAQLGWPREAIYVTNAVKHFKYEPRGRRRLHKTPAQKEADACLHWLESEIALVRPRAIVALGATAARQLMGRAVPVMRERGQWLRRADGLPVLITLHPSALLRLEAADRDAAYEAWLSDLRGASSHLGS